MASREDQATPHQPLLSSLIIRPSDSGGGGVSDYEPGEVRRDPPPYSRFDRYSDAPGYRIRAGSGSPVHRRDVGHHYGSEYDHSAQGRGFGRRRDFGRHRDTSPPYGRGRGGGRPFTRGFDGMGPGPGHFRGEGIGRSNPNVRPREGDWICSDPFCGNLNFARREFCNKCKRPRFGHGGSPPRRRYPGPPPPPLSHSRNFSGPPMDFSPGRNVNGYRSPPRGWGSDGPRDFLVGDALNPRQEGRFPDHDLRRDRLDYIEDNYRERNRFDRPMPPFRDCGRENFYNGRKGYERRPPSPLPPAPLPEPPLLPHRGRWGHHDMRERSRSPIRASPPKDYCRDMYINRGRGDRRGVMRDAY